MNYFEAGRLKDLARTNGITADRTGLPPRQGESLNRNTDCSVVVWLGGTDYEFQNAEEAHRWLTNLIQRRRNP